MGLYLSCTNLSGADNFVLIMKDLSLSFNITVMMHFVEQMWQLLLVLFAHAELYWGFTA